MTEQSWPVITEAAELADVVSSLVTAERYAIDTEFHRERTYYPQLALIQIAWFDELVLIDPLAVDVSPLAEVLDGPGTAVIHASTQDLEVLELETGSGPSRLFDTQIAAAFIGMRTPSLGALHDHFLGLKLPKANRLTDWLRRPLEPGQLSYAASDVERLLEIEKLLVEELVKLDRLDWAEDECDLVLTRGVSVRDPGDAWLRIKEARSLGQRARTAAREVARWRELKAQERDVPVRHVLPDLGVVALAQRPAKRVEDFAKTRGLERRSVSKRDAAELIEVLANAKDLEPPEAPPRKSTKGPDVRPAVTLIAAWMAQFADDLKLDPAMLGARADIEDFVRGLDSRLDHGWRNDLVGTPMAALLAGEAAVAFDGDGRVVVEKRSYQPVSVNDLGS